MLSTTRTAIITLALIVTSFAPAMAGPVQSFHYDVAPNVYGSPDWDPWWDQAKQDIADGSFTNLRSGTFPGTNRMTPSEEIATSFGDLGNRLHFIYWLPEASYIQGDGETGDRTNPLVQTRFAFDWNGQRYEYGYSTPSESTFEAFQGGVIGTFGMAFAAHSPEEVTSLADQIASSQTYLDGSVRTSTDGGETWTSGPSAQLEITQVPVPGSFVLLAFAIMALTGASVQNLRGKA